MSEADVYTICGNISETMQDSRCYYRPLMLSQLLYPTYRITAIPITITDFAFSTVIFRAAVQ